MFDTKKVLNPPALRLEGEWEDVAPQICEEWVKSQAAHAADKVSVMGLAKMKALTYELTHVDKKDRRLLPKRLQREDEKSSMQKVRERSTGKQEAVEVDCTEQDYVDAMVRAFLEAVGEDPDKVMASFRNTGVGALHRQHAVFASQGNGAFSAAQNFTPDLTAKVVLAAVQIATSAVVAKTSLDSGRRRFRNAATEEIMALGRADASPTAKTGPGLLRSVIPLRELGGAQKTLREIEQALDDIQTAVDAQQSPKAIQEARDRLEIAFAKYCYLSDLKSRYKAAREMVKVEWHGNKRYLRTSYASAALAFGTGLLGTLTPIAVSAAATGGVSAAAIPLGFALYVGYQLSQGPSKDGEAKANRAIVALGKSADLLDGDVMALQRDRAQAYSAYRKARKSARFKTSSERAALESTAEKELLEELHKITARDKPDQNQKFQPADNWNDYTEYEATKKKIHESIRAEPWKIDDLHEELAREEAKFEARHAAHFNRKTVTDAWKTPLRIRLDGARKRLAGDVARLQRLLIESKKQARLEEEGKKLRRPGWQEANQARQERLMKHLTSNLVDLLNLELAMSRMQYVVSESGKASAASAAPAMKKPMEQAMREGMDPAVRDAMKQAREALASIRNPHVRALFCGDGRTQVDELTKARELVDGEKERYTYTNAGAAALGILLTNVAAPVTGLAVNIAKLDLAAHGIHRTFEFGDKNIFNLFFTNSIAPLTAPYNAADRTPHQKAQRTRIAAATARSKEDRIDLAFPMPELGSGVLSDNHPAVVNLIDNLTRLSGVPDTIAIDVPRSMARSPEDGTRVKTDLTTTTGYQKERAKSASIGQKMARGKEQAGVFFQEVATAAGAVIVEPAAVLLPPGRLKRSRAPLKKMNELDASVRAELAKKAPQPSAIPQARGRQTSDSAQPPDRPARKPARGTRGGGRR
ncbi:hypothetical protein AB3X96_39880 [Paraburkholderia sp. BR13439]|uniref:hypothetical protein n=1 Tax=Paraburkholderia sp. BR13439 TaxID=3236996 RepID=UPI0034CF894F